MINSYFAVFIVSIELMVQLDILKKSK